MGASEHIRYRFGKKTKIERKSEEEKKRIRKKWKFKIYMCTCDTNGLKIKTSQNNLSNNTLSIPLSPH